MLLYLLFNNISSNICDSVTDILEMSNADYKIFQLNVFAQDLLQEVCLLIQFHCYSHLPCIYILIFTVNCHKIFKINPLIKLSAVNFTRKSLLLFPALDPANIKVFSVTYINFLTSL